MEKITFIECQQSGYKARTMENAKADVTIAIAEDYYTAGERCTKNCVIAQGKEYHSIYYHHTEGYEAVMNIVRMLNRVKPKVINIAGNGLYTLNTTQEAVDTKILYLFKNIFEYYKEPIDLIRSGGQTGIDEAGLKAAVKLNIPALCLAPKGWLFRDHNYKDIADEQQFKARFN